MSKKKLFQFISDFHINHRPTVDFLDFRQFHAFFMHPSSSQRHDHSSNICKIPAIPKCTCPFCPSVGQKGEYSNHGAYGLTGLYKSQLQNIQMLVMLGVERLKNPNRKIGVAAGKILDFSENMSTDDVGLTFRTSYRFSGITETTSRQTLLPASSYFQPKTHLHYATMLWLDPEFWCRLGHGHIGNLPQILNMYLVYIHIYM